MKRKSKRTKFSFASVIEKRAGRGNKRSGKFAFLPFSFSHWGMHTGISNLYEQYATTRDESVEKMMKGERIWNMPFPMYNDASAVCAKVLENAPHIDMP